MKGNTRRIRKYLPWLLLLLIYNSFFVLLLWITDIQAFHALSAVLMLSSVLGFSAISGVLIFLEHKKENSFLAFLEHPDEYQEEKLIKAVGISYAEIIHYLGTILRDNQNKNNLLQTQMEDYEEYVESWAHEIKVPLSLLTLLLDNRRDEIPQNMKYKLDYVQTCMQEYIDQILYYARIKGVRKDYLFEPLPIHLCVEEVLEDYQPLLEEKGFLITKTNLDGFVYTDRRGLRFLIEQIVSNTIKYSDNDTKKEPQLCCSFIQKDRISVLTICDNGMGVKRCDLPYIFEKGFTGDSGENRKKATGMGLYLAKEVARDLGLSLEAFSQWGEGFQMQIQFPVINIK